ncbi:polysaccharide lyase family 7 protein [Flavivirga sp. 57AJ16]|uniref:polysaccharide lyase family 7 protein n=1 Tax=Flavivirga sp. 57AJ16 TaxID=3025307 RepID=UPI0023666B9C|nr:polysaccharide lyase family 7 protein [Flavivirga sp. 57AJ16]MDD7887515.1 polysaccharide lyase family 7 protein [Flavivirga sp. 57AJ16]
MRKVVSKKKCFYINAMVIYFLIIASLLSCSTEDKEVQLNETQEEDKNPNASYADIDFNHWKITLPVDLNGDSKPDEYQPSDLIDFGYQTITDLQPFMYDDATDTSIVFYTYPGNATTANSSYPRTELREQQTPGSNYDNWSLVEGGVMDGTLQVASVSNDTETSRQYHRIIVMQIHGIISQEDMTTYNFSSNHAPPLLKMIWIDGKLFAYKKTLVDESTSGLDLYDDSSSTWTDIKYDFGYVGFDSFQIKITARQGEIMISANNKNYTFQDISLEKWPFENYFKAGNYLTATDPTAHASIKYYNLKVTH